MKTAYWSKKKHQKKGFLLKHETKFGFFLLACVWQTVFGSILQNPFPIKLCIGLIVEIRFLFDAIRHLTKSTLKHSLQNLVIENRALCDVSNCQGSS